jgi:hypothetical protein
MNKSTLSRASNRQPCPICHKPDWCMVAADAAICMRVESSRPHTFKNGAMGWYHWLEDPLPNFKPEKKIEAPTIDARRILSCMESAIGSRPLEELAKSLGVTYSSLRLLGCVWSPNYKAWAFPMRGGDGEYRGIRLRSDDGKKWAVRGSKEGVFYAFGNPNATTLYVVEGPTDTAAAMTLGLDCVGRPSCYGGVEEVRIIVRNQKYRRVAIIADRDDVGRWGAKLLSDALFVPRAILSLPCKDMREFVRNDGSAAMLDNLLKGTLWTSPKHQASNS